MISRIVQGVKTCNTKNMFKATDCFKSKNISYPHITHRYVGKKFVLNRLTNEYE